MIKKANGKCKVQCSGSWGSERLPRYWQVLVLRLGKRHVNSCHIAMYTRHIYHTYSPLQIKYFTIPIVCLNEPSGHQWPACWEARVKSRDELEYYCSGPGRTWQRVKDGRGVFGLYNRTCGEVIYWGAKALGGTSWKVGKSRFKCCPYPCGMSTKHTHEYV